MVLNLKHIVSMSFEFNCLHPYLLQTMKVQIVNDRQTIPDVWCKSPINLYSERLTLSTLSHNVVSSTSRYQWDLNLQL
jgi:hypothetical protein